MYNKINMEVLTPSQITSIVECEKETISLPTDKIIPIIPFKQEPKQIKSGAIFQKVCSSCEAPSKYQCPRCSTLSCSVDCVKAHKIANDCDGQREKTAFVPVEEFNDSKLHSDFHFLEEMRREIDVARRGKKGKGLLCGLLPHNLMRLQTVARLRKTDLQILPVAFSKRKRNTTYLRYSDKKIFWRLEWEFPHIEFSCVDERVDEDEILGNCVDKYINEKSKHTDEKFSYYHSLKFSEIAVLMKDENSPSKVEQYHILELNKSLKSNFRYKKIIEYPSFLVISKLHLSCYQTVP